ILFDGSSHCLHSGAFCRDLGKATHAAVPNALYTFLALTSGLLALKLPETRDLDLPDTLQEGEDLGEASNKVKKDSTNPATEI
ncbi:hypothetical protein TNCT_623721, partial [Trichonephila clavata]